MDIVWFKMNSKFRGKSLFLSFRNFVSFRVNKVIKIVQDLIILCDRFFCLVFTVSERVFEIDYVGGNFRDFSLGFFFLTFR